MPIAVMLIIGIFNLVTRNTRTTAAVIEMIGCDRQCSYVITYTVGNKNYNGTYVCPNICGFAQLQSNGVPICYSKLFPKSHGSDCDGKYIVGVALISTVFCLCVCAIIFYIIVRRSTCQIRPFSVDQQRQQLQQPTRSDVYDCKIMVVETPSLANEVVIGIKEHSGDHDCEQVVVIENPS
jgi:hypothetical protein